VSRGLVPELKQDHWRRCVPKRFMAYVPGSTPVVVADTTAPTVPTNVTASAVTSSGFTVSWTASTDAVGVTGYSVQLDGTTYGTTTGATTLAVSGRAASTAYSVRVQARDAAGNFSGLSTAITATTSALATGGTPVNLFSAQTPSTTDANDNQGITLTTRFVSDVDGNVTGVRFYRSVTAPTSAIGVLYSDAGVELARATFGTLTTGWNSVTFATPVGTTAGSYYRAGYWSSGPYVYSSAVFASPVVNAHLTGTGGYYGYSASPASGNQQFNDNGYFADVLFVVTGSVAAATAPAIPAAPTVTADDASIVVTWVAPSNGGSAITGYDVQPFAGATGGAVTSVGNVTNVNLTGLTNGTAYTVKVRAKNAIGNSAYSSASSAVTPTATVTSSITHGDQLTVNHVGPWTLQGTAKGSESITALAGPSRGYWRFDTPDDFLPTTAWPTNANDANPSILNAASLKGGVVTGSPVIIDGYSVPVGTRIVQYRDFPDGYDFYAQGTTLKVMFRGCRFRWTSGTGGSGIFNDNGAPTAQQVMLHYCDLGLLSLDPPNGTQGLMHIKFLGGYGHRLLRNYYTRSSTFLQPNVGGSRIVENYIDEYIYAYGEAGPSGAGPDSTTLHLNGFSSEGGLTDTQILRNRIVCPSPDGSTGSTGFAAGQVGYGTKPGQIGYGAGSAPGRLTTQTDNIAIFAITNTNNGVTISDNYLGGAGYCLYAGNADGAAKNIVVTGNKFTTRWWTNAGSHGPITDVPAWGTNGNAQSNNTWADDYGTGGDGTTATSGRQYPTGNGPRKGTSAF
jgi:hypothetical protein